MYKAIRARPSSVKLLGDLLVASGVMTEEWRASLAAKLNEHLEAEWAAANRDYDSTVRAADVVAHMMRSAAPGLATVPVLNYRSPLPPLLN